MQHVRQSYHHPGNRAAGKGLTLTFWDSEEAERASAPAADQIRTQAATTLGVETQSVEVYEVAAQAPAKEGRPARAQARRRHPVRATKRSSWLNLVDRWFAEITRKRLRRGAFRSVAELERAIYEYLRENNKHPRPFIWTATASTIMRKIKHCKEALDAGD